MANLVELERQHRLDVWRMLTATDGSLGVSPTVLRSLGVYGGAQGIWVDKERTQPLTQEGTGVTVAVLHTGSSYPDDLSEDGMLYHYPVTKRPEGRDRSEVEATKAAGKLNLPVFVITYPAVNSTRRDVRLGWVADWDDASREFLITFGETPTQAPQTEQDEEKPFQLQTGRSRAIREVEQRPGQAAFKFKVLKRYGPQCAACDLAVLAVLDAAHLFPKQKGGTDDPRNGLVFCATHHRAFDAGLFVIQPDSLRFICKPGGPPFEVLKITKPSLDHLVKKPHHDALEWRWMQWNGKTDRIAEPVST